MKTFPDLDRVREYAAAGGYGSVPVAKEIHADMYTPVGVLRCLQKVSDHCYMLESAEDANRWGRYSFLGYDPVLDISCKDGILTVGDANGEKGYVTKNPGAYIRRIIGEYRAPRVEGMPSFAGGLVGYFSYDYIKYAEPCLDFRGTDDAHFKDLDLMLFDKVICFDNLRHKIILIASAKLSEPVETAYAKAINKIAAMERIVRACDYAPVEPLAVRSAFRPRFTEEEYCSMVERAKRYIFEGDIFQVVLANRLEAEIKGSILDVYRVLRTTNPSPYMFYFRGTDIELAGASPETLAKLQDGVLNTFPLAGTRPRGKTREEDLLIEKDLLSDEKELAEHNMLVDLGRNDIGKISRLGTVTLEKYLEIERYSHVMHIGSTVRGEIRDDRDYIDTVNAILPAGTLSGAPKIRACEIIDELEGCRRGIYGGAVGYIDFTGNLDTCISIRMAYAKDGMLYVCSGAGIVADSVPEREHQECLNKARAVMDAVKTAAGGLER